MMFSEIEKQVAMKTYRARLPGGKTPMCYRMIEKFAERNDNEFGKYAGRVLDYGCGAQQVHVPMLQGIFGKERVFACDFSIPGSREECLKREYGIVLASNVLNVIPTVDGIRLALKEIQACLLEDGYAIVNYPASPRKAGLSVQELEALLVEQFPVELMPESLVGKNFVWMLRHESKRYLGNLLTTDKRKQ
jgi:hypothetical protein